MRILLSIMAAAALLPAQSFEAGLHAGVSRIGANLGAGYSLGNGFRIGARMTTNTEGFFGHEFGYAYNRTQLQQSTGQGGGFVQTGMAVHQGLYHFLAYANRAGARVRPFAAGGVHFSNFTPPGASAFQGGGDTKYGFNYGGGIKFRVTDTYMVRFDLRQYGTPKPFNLPLGGLLRQTEISVGFSYTM